MQTNEDKFWAKIRLSFEFSWRMEDKLTPGRPDVLYRIPGVQADTGVLELKAHPVPLDRAFWSGLKGHQAACLREWGSVRPPQRAHLLVQFGSRWAAFGVDSKVVMCHADKWELDQFMAMAKWIGTMDAAGYRKLQVALFEHHMGR